MHFVSCAPPVRLSSWFLVIPQKNSAILECWTEPSKIELFEDRKTSGATFDRTLGEYKPMRDDGDTEILFGALLCCFCSPVNRDALGIQWYGLPVYQLWWGLVRRVELRVAGGQTLLLLKYCN